MRQPRSATLPVAQPSPTLWLQVSVSKLLIYYGAQLAG